MNAHEGRQTTPEELQKDVVNITNQIFQAWDSEVDVVVVLVPRRQPVPGKLDLYMSSTATSMELVKKIAEGVRLKAPLLVNLRGRT